MHYLSHNRQVHVKVTIIQLMYIQSDNDNSSIVDFMRKHNTDLTFSYEYILVRKLQEN